jgi:tRNA nucleotidyltransferase (CCA-adding enzyme)
MEKQINAVTARVLHQITPTAEEKAKVEALSRKLEGQIAAACQSEGVPAVVRVEGSVAKNTWLAQTQTSTFSCDCPHLFPEKVSAKSA